MICFEVWWISMSQKYIHQRSCWFDQKLYSTYFRFRIELSVKIELIIIIILQYILIQISPSACMKPQIPPRHLLSPTIATVQAVAARSINSLVETGTDGGEWAALVGAEFVAMAVIVAFALVVAVDFRFVFLPLPVLFLRNGSCE